MYKKAKNCKQSETGITCVCLCVIRVVFRCFFHFSAYFSFKYLLCVYIKKREEKRREAKRHIRQNGAPASLFCELFTWWNRFECIKGIVSVIRRVIFFSASAIFNIIWFGVDKEIRRRNLCFDEPRRLHARRCSVLACVCMTLVTYHEKPLYGWGNYWRQDPTWLKLPSTFDDKIIFCFVVRFEYTNESPARQVNEHAESCAAASIKFRWMHRIAATAAAALYLLLYSISCAYKQRNPLINHIFSDNKFIIHLMANRGQQIGKRYRKQRIWIYTYTGTSQRIHNTLSLISHYYDYPSLYFSRERAISPFSCVCTKRPYANRCFYFLCEFLIRR